MHKPVSSHAEREAVRLLALSIGVREAARKFGLNENRVMQWSARYNWLPQPAIQPDLPKTMQSDLVSSVSKAADSLANELIDHGRKTKYNLSKAAMRAADTFSEMPGEKVIDKSDRLMNITKVASTIHGWQDTQAASALNLNVLSGGRAIVQVAQTNDSKDSDST